VRATAPPRADRAGRVRGPDRGELVHYAPAEGPEYDGVLDLAKAAIDRMGLDGGIDVDIESEAPPGSGLGGSSALVTAVVAGLACLDERSMSCDELAALSYTIEREDLGIAGGWQDQYSAAYGGLNLIEFRAEATTVTPAQVGADALEEVRKHLLLCYTGKVRRNVGLIDRQIEMFRAGREDTLLGMKQLREMAYAMRDAIEAVDMRRLGAMLREAFEAKKRMNPHIAEETPIEAMLAAASSAGATGGKICGAGGGGYLLIASPPEARAAVRSALESMGGQFAPFEVDPQGVRARRDDRRWTPSRP
jgi:D-glycero-alpha-D-manno-heptose-7-phosphate kinase